MQVYCILLQEHGSCSGPIAGPCKQPFQLLFEEVWSCASFTTFQTYQAFQWCDAHGVLYFWLQSSHEKQHVNVPCVYMCFLFTKSQYFSKNNFNIIRKIISIFFPLPYFADIEFGERCFSWKLDNFNISIFRLIFFKIGFLGYLVPTNGILMFFEWFDCLMMFVYIKIGWLAKKLGFFLK